jgi:uncharacterized protein
MRAIKFVFYSLSVFFGIIYLLFVSYIYFNQAEMVFSASKLPADYKFTYKQPFQEFHIPSFDGKKLNGLLFKVDHSKGLIFYLHGNMGNLSTWGNIAEVYTNLGYDVFILDYRGFGKSEGIIDNQEQVLKDVSSVYNSLLKMYNEQNISIIGYSIGTGPATFLASMNNPRQLILQAPYYNFTEFSNGRVPYIPNFLKKFSFANNEFIKKVKSPVFIFHGKNDHVINYHNSVNLQKLFKKGDQLIALENQDHIGINENIDFQNRLKVILK